MRLQSVCQEQVLNESGRQRKKVIRHNFDFFTFREHDNLLSTFVVAKVKERTMSEWATGG